MSISEKLKESIVIVVSVAAISAFGMGWAAYKATLAAGGQLVVAKSALAELELRANQTCAPQSPSEESCRGVRATGSKFDFTKWQYLPLAGKNGDEVAAELTRIGPAEDSVVVVYDGGTKNTFHVWYSGGKTGTKFQYDYAQPNALRGDPKFNYFRNEPGMVPAGIGGVGNDSVPIFFRVTR